MFTRRPAPVIVGDLSRPIGTRPVRHIQCAEDLESVEEGELFERWNWHLEWGIGCVRPSVLESLRHKGDPLSDAVVRFLNLKPRQDGLKHLLEYTESTPRQDWDEDVAAFWDEIARDPPEGVSALRDDSIMPSSDGRDSGYSSDTEKASVPMKPSRSQSVLPEDAVYTPEEAMHRGDREPSAILSEGQATFWRYSGDMFFTLLHFSLAGGFASARIMSVLHETGYLTSSSRDATYRRLMETTQALCDFMSDMTPITGKGWKSAIRVRMLHSQVRIRILDGRGRIKKYDLERDGLPVNQEDLLATLGGFCMAPLWCQKKLGIKLTRREELAFIAAWRHIGYYLGILPSSLQDHFGTSSAASPSSNHRFFACIAMHLFASPEPPKDPLGTATYKILHSVAHRPPGDKTTLYHCELSRMYLGAGLADQLAIPRGSLKERLQVQQHAWNSWITAKFSRHYLTRWERQRQAVFRRVITLIVAWQLGEKRSNFSWREEKDHDKKISELASGEAGEGPGMEISIHVGLEVRSQVHWLFGEMAGVLVVMGVTTVLAGWQAVRLAVGLFR